MIKSPFDSVDHCGNIHTAARVAPERRIEPATAAPNSPVQVNEVHAMTNQIAALKLLSQKKRTSHVLHLILSILSVGFWIPVWLLVALSNSIENARIDRKVAKL